MPAKVPTGVNPQTTITVGDDDTSLDCASATWCGVLTLDKALPRNLEFASVDDDDFDYLGSP